MNTNSKTVNLSIMALLSALIFVLQFVTVPLGPITVSLSMVPVSIAAIVLGPVSGLIAGGIWGLASVLKAMFGASGMTSVLFGMNPFYTLIICFIPRMLDGFLLGYLYKLLRLKLNNFISGCAVGFFSAFLNTVFFMSAIVLLFGSTEYIQDMMGGRNIIIFICSIIAGNAIFEMLVSAVVTGPVSVALEKTKLITKPA